MKKFDINKFNQIKAIAYPGHPPTKDSNIPQLREVAELASWIDYDIDPLMMAIHQAEEKHGLALSNIMSIGDRRKMAKLMDITLGGTTFSNILEREIRQLLQLHLQDTVTDFLETTGTIGELYIDTNPHPSANGYLAQVMTEEGQISYFGNGSEIIECTGPKKLEVLLEFMEVNEIPVPGCQLTKGIDQEFSGKISGLQLFEEAFPPSQMEELSTKKT
jgi:hypothetical protein